MRNAFTLAALAALLATPPAMAAERFDLAAGHGFDWTRPRGARCEALTPRRVQALPRCEFPASGAFGLDLAHYTCRSDSGELLVFRNAGECREALETMKAHAP